MDKLLDGGLVGAIVACRPEWVFLVQRAIVEDAITTGGSVRQALSGVEELGGEVTLVAVLVERHEGGGDKLRADGYDVVSLFRTDEDGKLTINESFLERLAAAQKAPS